MTTGTHILGAALDLCFHLVLLVPGDGTYMPFSGFAAYYRGAMGIVVVYDVTDEASFNNVRNWMRNIEQHASDTVSNKVCLLFLYATSGCKASTAQALCCWKALFVSGLGAHNKLATFAGARG